MTSARIVIATAFAALCSSALAQTPQGWYRNGQAAVEEAKRLSPNNAEAKNVILFIGDGMGVTTVTAARILEGQLRGDPGEENRLSFEELPFTALVKTYNVNQQVPDSAGTMTAIVTGVKTDAWVLSVNHNVTQGDYTTVAGNELTTIVELAEKAGRSTGIVTTTRVTHATPAACYAHVAERGWENDSDLPDEAKAADFKDIARQLIEFPFGDGIEVVLGGGRREFLPKTVNDPEDAGKSGERSDGRDLTTEWRKMPRAAYVWNKADFDAIDVSATDHLLGLFERSHMEYEHDRPKDKGGEPSLSEMTAKAIDLLSRNHKGFFLVVEGGRIDLAHHRANAYRALTETVEFAKAVELATDKTDRRDTLIIVTADHDQVLTFSGYPVRGNPILGKVVGVDEQGNLGTDFTLDALGLPYTALNYADGPGYTGTPDVQPEGATREPNADRPHKRMTKGRPDLTNVNTEAPDYLNECLVPTGYTDGRGQPHLSGTHGGADVPLYAGGPQAHLFHGVLEQNVIFHVMVEALGLEP
ncbi:MAG: alkaline phosphatase [Phycisphaerales bacterium]|nr:MAG: alkaline phosphatase [Phycisphaerales bacterium]